MPVSSIRCIDFRATGARVQFFVSDMMSWVLDRSWISSAPRISGSWQNCSLPISILCRITCASLGSSTGLRGPTGATVAATILGVVQSLTGAGVGNGGCQLHLKTWRSEAIGKLPVASNDTRTGLLSSDRVKIKRSKSASWFSTVKRSRRFMPGFRDIDSHQNRHGLCNYGIGHSRSPLRYGLCRTTVGT